MEEESILPDDIRQLMEELEAEAAEIKQNKARREKVEAPEEETVEPLETMEEETVETVETKEEEPIDRSAKRIILHTDFLVIEPEAGCNGQPFYEQVVESRLMIKCTAKSRGIESSSYA